MRGVPWWFVFQRGGALTFPIGCTGNGSAGDLNVQNVQVHCTVGGRWRRQSNSTHLGVKRPKRQCHGFADQHSQQRVLDPAQYPSEQQGLELDWSPPKQPGSSTTGAHGQGPCQRISQRQESLTGPYPDRTNLCLALSSLQLANDSNHCYNAAFMALMWAMANRFGFELCHLGTYAS